jgi:hypothetical protein
MTYGYEGADWRRDSLIINAKLVSVMEDLFYAG